ncbi:BrnA antitoxin family protein [bacterium]|nr:BrnA antitoxin family protein [bacterium]
MKRKTLKKIPKFRNEDEERAFWSVHDSSEYVNWDSAEKAALSKLKPSSKTISIRLPQSLLEELKRIANRRDVPYQSLMKIFLAERIEEELNK